MICLSFDMSVLHFGVYVCVCLTNDYRQTPLPILMKFGINLLGTKAMYVCIRICLFPSHFKMAAVLWVSFTVRIKCLDCFIASCISYVISYLNERGLLFTELQILKLIINYRPYSQTTKQRGLQEVSTETSNVLFRKSDNDLFFPNKQVVYKN